MPGSDPNLPQRGRLKSGKYKKGLGLEFPLLNPKYVQPVYPAVPEDMPPEILSTYARAYAAHELNPIELPKCPVWHPKGTPCPRLGEDPLHPEGDPFWDFENPSYRYLFDGWTVRHVKMSILLLVMIIRLIR